jgi:gas vesicle protein
MVMQAKSLIGGLVIGAALGTAAGLLVAPRSGEETRKKIIKGSRRLKKNIANYIDESMDSVREQLSGKIDKLARRGRDTINAVSEKVKI